MACAWPERRIYWRRPAVRNTATRCPLGTRALCAIVGAAASAFRNRVGGVDCRMRLLTLQRAFVARQLHRLQRSRAGARLLVVRGRLPASRIATPNPRRRAGRLVGRAVRRPRPLLVRPRRGRRLHARRDPPGYRRRAARTPCGRETVDAVDGLPRDSARAAAAAQSSPSCTRCGSCRCIGESLITMPARSALCISRRPSTI